MNTTRTEGEQMMANSLHSVDLGTPQTSIDHHDRQKSTNFNRRQVGRHRSWLIGCLMTGLLGSMQIASGDDGAVEQPESSARILKGAVKPGRSAARKSTVGAMTAEREAVLTEFAKSNHPELATLMQTLKTKAPQDYQAALTDLDRTVEPILKLKDKSAEKYETQLAEWKNMSRIRLLEARLAVTGDQSVEQELRTALTERLKFSLAAQRTERERLQKRLEKLDQSIDETTSDPEAVVDRQLTDLRKKLSASKPATRSRSKKTTDETPSTDKPDMK